MRTIVKLIRNSLLAISLILLASCQEEAFEIIQEAPEEVLTANSEVATLMQKTATNDGSKDNILDNSSCFNVELPVTINVNGLDMIVDSEEDFEVIEAIFDQFEDDDDIVDFVFPITIILADHTEVVINNQEQLEEYMDLCQEEDDDIECIDFVYPITFSIYNSSNNLIGTETVEKDRELYHFVKNIKQSDIISINFPIELKMSDETIVTVNNMMELLQAIDAAKDSCDEDDDNDFGDDDFTKERLDNLLVKCPWIVHDMLRNALSVNDKYREYVMIFHENGVVKVRSRNGDQLTGEWATRITDEGAKLKLEFTNLMDFTLEWTVHDISHGKIKLFTENDNRIILEKACDLFNDHTVERFKNILTECLWRITRLEIEGTDHEDDYLGTPFKFFEDGRVKLRVQGELVEGTYEVGKVHGSLYLIIHLENRPNLKLKWLVTVLENGRIKLVNEESKMVLKRYCEENVDEDVRFIRNVMTSGEWEIALYTDDDENETSDYDGYHLEFYENGKVLAEGNGSLVRGSWIVLRDDGKLYMELNFGDHDLFEEFNEDWRIVSIDEHRIELHDLEDDGTIKSKVVLERL
jgi:hypothetical protein